MVDEGKFLFIDLCLLKNVEGMKESMTHHLPPRMNELGSHSSSRKDGPASHKDGQVSLLMAERGTTYAVALPQSQT